MTKLQPKPKRTFPRLTCAVCKKAVPSNLFPQHMDTHSVSATPGPLPAQATTARTLVRDLSSTYDDVSVLELLSEAARLARAKVSARWKELKSEHDRARNALNNHDTGKPARATAISRVLELLAASPEGVLQKDLLRFFPEVPSSTVYATMNVLRRKGQVEMVPGTKRVRLRAERTEP